MSCVTNAAHIIICIFAQIVTNIHTTFVDYGQQKKPTPEWKSAFLYQNRELP